MRAFDRVGAVYDGFELFSIDGFCPLPILRSVSIADPRPSKLPVLQRSASALSPAALLRESHMFAGASLEAGAHHLEDERNAEHHVRCGKAGRHLEGVAEELVPLLRRQESVSSTSVRTAVRLTSASGSQPPRSRALSLAS